MFKLFLAVIFALITLFVSIWALPLAMMSMQMTHSPDAELASRAANSIWVLLAMPLVPGFISWLLFKD